MFQSSLECVCIPLKWKNILKHKAQNKEGEKNPW